MKILYITSCFPNSIKPQYCIFLEQQARSLMSLGNAVDVLVPVPNNEVPKMNNELSCYGGMNVYKVPYKIHSFKGLIGSIDRKFKNSINEIVKKNKYSIISIHYLIEDQLLNVLLDASINCGIKCNIHFHGLNVWKDYYHPHPWLQKLWAFKRERAFKRADFLVGVSDKVNNIIRDRIDSKPIYTVYNGVDTEKFHGNNEVDKGFNRIVSVGNLIPIKGHEYLLKAFSRLLETNKDISLYIIGDGTERKKLEELANELKIKNNVLFTGNIPYEKVAELMRNANIFVLPSYYEAFGCVYLEAMASEIAVIGIYGQGIEEIIIDGVNGLLAKPKDVDSLFEKMDYLISNPNEANVLARNGRKTADHYTWLNSAKELVKIYEMTLAK